MRRLQRGARLSRPRALPAALRIGPDDARRLLLGQLALNAPWGEAGQVGVRGVLQHLRCIQLDPIDRVGTNADLVALARVDGLRRGEVYEAVAGGHGFEHFAKEYCLLPASAFPWYRDRAVQTPWWRLHERLQRLPAALIAEVLAEVQERGPIPAEALEDRGAVQPLDWSGWKGTGRATAMALEVLRTRCQVVVVGRTPRGKVYDVPARAFPTWAAAPTAGDFARWAILERTAAAGLLSTAGGPHWSMLSEERTHGRPEALVEAGELVRVQLPGSARAWYTLPALLERSWPEPDGRMRWLGPLDPLIWDRELVRRVFGFDYVWEVYKPAEQRRWGWYVCPLLYAGQLVGRVEAHLEGDPRRLVIDRLHREEGRPWDEDAWQALRARHEQACVG